MRNCSSSTRSMEIILFRETNNAESGQSNIQLFFETEVLSLHYFCFGRYGSIVSTNMQRSTEGRAANFEQLAQKMFFRFHAVFTTYLS